VLTVKFADALPALTVPGWRPELSYYLVNNGLPLSVMLRMSSYRRRNSHSWVPITYLAIILLNTGDPLPAYQLFDRTDWWIPRIVASAASAVCLSCLKEECGLPPDESFLGNECGSGEATIPMVAFKESSVQQSLLIFGCHSGFTTPARHMLSEPR
jgi:hypothetical protein